MAHIHRTKTQTIYYRILINLQIILHKLSISYQQQSMNVYLEIPPIKKFLIHPNINTKKALETVNTLISNECLIKPVPTNQKEIGSVKSFGLIHLAAEQYPQMLQKGFSNYYATISHPPTSFKKYLIRTKSR